MILCVDDDSTGLMVRKILLQRQGYQVITALSGPEGLQLLMAHPVEAVVLDYERGIDHPETDFLKYSREF